MQKKVTCYMKVTDDQKGHDFLRNVQDIRGASVKKGEIK